MIIVRLQFEGYSVASGLHPAFRTGILPTLNVIGRMCRIFSAHLYPALLSLLLPPLPCTLFLALLFLLRLGGFRAFAQGYLRQLL
jgi:hypothetical protein